MRILHTADLHISDGPRLADQVRTLASIADQVEAQSPDLMVVAGDLYGHTVPHESKAAERTVVISWLRRCARVCPIVIVAGNHDAPKDADDLAKLDTDHGVHVAPAADGIQSLLVNGIHVDCIPYPRRSRISDWLREQGRDADAQTRDAVGSSLLDQALLLLADDIRERQGHTVVVGHLAVTGAAVAGGERLAAREVEASTAALQQLRQAGADYIALGHIHLCQEIAPGAWYPGSPHRVDHGEVEAQKSVNVAEISAAGTAVSQVPVWSRAFVTVDATYTEDGWEMPELDHGDAEVRLRLHIPDEYRTTADRAEVESLVTESAARVVTEVHLERETRVRSEELATAESDADRLGAYWATLDDNPPDEHRKTALAELHALEVGEELVERAEGLLAEVLGEEAEVAA